MRRRLLIPCCGLLMFLTGSVGASGSGLPPDLSIQVTITTDYHPVAQTQVFSLTCSPPAGTLPLADRVCADIRSYPSAMLAPRLVGHRIDCPGMLDASELTVAVTAGAKTTVFGQGSCNNPDGVAGSVYLAAIRGDQKELDGLETVLRCDEDPYFFAHPTEASIGACLGGLWTTSAEALIRLAKRNPRIAGLGPADLFPRDVGAQTCVLPAGKSAGGRAGKAQCGVLVNDFSTEAVVTFVEYQGPGNVFFEPWTYKQFTVLGNLSVREPSKRRNWLVVIKKNRVVSVTQTGAGSPPAPCPRCQPHS